MKVEIELKETSQKITYNDATNTYTKGPFYCVYQSENNKVEKWPVSNIWRVSESYSDPKPDSKLLMESN